eukprot:CAMPEP_0115179882 /NCGR_PEP_ID=MMETSP0270-20121206/6634_1 /TAXON_ID=71861 /ORGANISM="Scrippsiella trochoidea, Strain CCMP3099" /LENGTH=56 /DNA_ID=CAMNT_0002592867 /DNA_START=179 /DNA_END=350 /DNA_ORIENTATION=+
MNEYLEGATIPAYFASAAAGSEYSVLNKNSSPSGPSGNCGSSIRALLSMSSLAFRA